MTHAALCSVASAVLVRTRRAGLLAVALAGVLHVVVAGQQAGTNVNIVKGTSLPGGDPFLQRQTEPSVAISTRNPCHLVASAVDYRTVDLEHADDANPTQLASGDAWLGFYKSFDCGQRWQSHLIPGYASDTSADGMASPLHGFEAGADGVVRAGSNGLFYYVGMVFQRDQSASKVFVSRFIDSNNKERGDTIEFAGTSVVASGDAQHFLDKPWIAVDIPRKALTVTTRGRDDEHGRDDDRDHDGVCVVNGQRVAAGNVYVGWTNFDVTTTTETSRIMFARSATCGRTWQQRPLFEHRHARSAHRHESHRGDRDFDTEDEDNEASRVVQGTAIAVAPADGAVYVAWRQFARNGLPSGIFVAKSTDGGSSFSAPQQLALINGFDQERGLTTFRTNAMPTIAADQGGRVYVAWAERGYASMPGRGDKLTGDSRIMLSVSPDRGRTWLPRYAIDNSYVDDAGVRRPVAGHQLMPSLSVAAGKVHVIWYDFRSDPCLVDPAKAMQPSCGSVNGVPNYEYIDGIDHLVTVQSATAAIGTQPAFTSVRMSQFPRSIDADGKVHEKTSHANLPLYSAGTKSFLGDYLDASALMAIPTRSAKNVQEWVPNTGVLTTPGGKLDPSAAPMAGFTTLPIFQGVWTDTRDVRPPQNGDWTLYFPPRRPSTPLAACNPDTAGMRDANIYSSRLTPGVYVGSPSNAKPLGFVTRDGVRQHLQRAFVVFIQNPLRETRYYKLTIVNQPGATNTDRASFNQFPSPPFKATNPSDKLHDPRIPPVITAWVAAPPISTVSRNVYVTAADPTAQVRVDVEETDAPLATPAPVPGQPAPTAAMPPLKVNGLRSSILLNPDPTSPALVGPDLVGNVPDIAELEVHEPVVDDPIFFNVNDPRTRSTALRTPADQNPADQNPADQNPADQNITDLNPADQNPADQNPADQNPADQNPAVEAVAFGDEVTGTGTLIRDVHFPVRNNGNTTTRYFFRPVVKSTSPDRKYQLLVTVRNNTLTVDNACNLKIDPQREVLVNVSNFRPRTPADQNPADQNPADQNPADQNPADQNPADQNPADQNPADQNTSFFLAPGDEATVTLRIYAPSSEFDTLPSPANDQVAAVVASASANTGETVAPTAAAGADLTVNDPPAALNVEFAEPGQLVDVSWTLKNRGTSPASSTNGSITTQFYLSTNGIAALRPGDVLLASTSREGDVPACTATTPTACAFAFVQPLTIPPTTVPSATPYFIKVITDPPNGDFPTGRVFEADETNNVAVVAVTVAVINDPPTFTTGPNQSLLRSAGAQTVDAWATNISAGPADEAAQTVNFVVTTDNTALFSVQPAITPAGTLTFTPAANATGSATVTVRLHDSGGTLFGGVDTSAAQTFVISVTAVNDAPSFVRGGDQTALEDAGAQSVPNWATNISAGPADEAGQLVDFRVLADNAALFAIAPAVSPSGTLTYTPAANANGTASVTVQLHDNGGTANGGVDTSAPQTFTISVTAVNDAPSFTRGADQTVPAGAGPQTVADWATHISAGPQDEAGQAFEFLVAAEEPALFSTAPAVSPAGTLTYTPLGGATGSTRVTVRLHDDGGTANGGVDVSAPQTFTITLAASAPTASSDSFATFEDVRLPVSACTAPIDYAGFSASSPFLTLAGDAALTATDADGGVLRLISALTPDGAFNFGARGAAWTGPPLSLANFHTTFTFRMTGGAAPFAPDPSAGWDGQGLGPDGLVFVLQNADAGVNALGGSGGALVSGITPSVGIEFDTFQSTEFADPDSNHIGIDINGSNVSVATAPVATRFDDGSLWTAWVDYDGTTLEVRASPDGVRPDAPNLAYPINLPAILGPSATAGFVAANGSNVANGDLVSWSSACTTPSLLSNDTDPNERPLTASLVTQASNGIATVNADGTFTYTPEPNFFGGDSFTYKANNGTTDSAPAVVTVIVNAVNDPPSFVKGPDQTAVADALPRTINPWATAISAGPANESGQSVFFVVSNDNNALFATQPAVEANTGTLSFTPNAGASGTAVVTVEARDNGGSATGGINTSAPQTFTITVTAVVNRTPTAADDTATTTENGAATIAVLANDSDPDGDPLTVTGVSEPSFGTAVVNADNTITYTPAFEFSGADTFSYVISDGRGGTATATVTITVVAVNDAPTFTKGADQTVAEDAGAQAVPNWATNISAGDSDDGGQAVNFVTANDNAALFSVQPAIDPDGTLRFTSAANAYGTATVTVRLHDDGGTANGGIDTSAAQVFTLTVTPVNDPPVANDDLAPPATANLPLDIDVTANDTDVDNGSGGTILATRPFGPTGLFFPSQFAVDALSGHLYVQTARVFGVVDPTQPAATALVASIATPFLTANQHRVDPVTRLIFFRAASAAAQNLITVLNPATNQIVGTLSFTSINAFAIDSLRSRLFVAAAGQLLLIDASPVSSTFLQTLFALPLGAAGAINAVAVDSVANRVYLAAAAGVWTVDGSNGTLTQIVGAPTPSSEIAVDDTRHHVFAAGTNGTTTTVAVIDGQTSALIGGGLAASGVVNNGSTGRRLVVNAATGKAYLRTTDAAFGSGWVVAIDPAGPTATAIALGARDDGDVGIASDDALNRIVTTANADLQLIVVDVAANQVSARLHTSQVAGGPVELDAARHRAYVSLFTSIATVDTQTQTVSTLPIAAEAASGVVDPSTHTFYLAITSDRGAIDAFDSTGTAMPVTGLPHQDGRYLFLGRDRSTGLLYAPNGDANAAGTNDGQPGFVAEIDGATNQVTQTIDAGNAPFGLAVNSTTHKLYVGNLAINGVSGGITEVTPAAHTSTAIDVSSLRDSGALLNIGRSMAINETSNRLYFQVVSGSNATGAMVDLANGNAVTRLPVSGTWGPIRELEVDGLRNRVFVATDPVGSTPGRLHILDGSTSAEIAVFDVFSASRAATTQAGVRVDETRGLVYVSDYVGNRLTIIDAVANTVKTTLSVCNGPGAVGINATTNRAYVACSREFAVTFIDGNGPGGSYRVVGYLPLPYQPGFLYVDDAASLVYVTSGNAPTPGLAIVRDLNGALDGVLRAATASTPTAQGGTTAINANGTVHYVPPQNFTGTDTFTYTATDGQAISNTATVTVHVFGQPVITTASPLPAATVNQPYTYTLSVSSALPVTWYLPTNLQLPLGLSLNGAGVISGAPTQVGVFTFLVEVADTEGSTTQATVTLAVNGPALQITTSTLRDAVVIENYGNAIAASGGAGARSFSIESGSLPPGITLNSNGSLSGTATTTGTFAFVVKAVDCAASSCAPEQTPQIATRALTLRVDAREQQTGGPQQPAISFGGVGGRKFAQTVTVGAQGTLVGVGVNFVTCPAGGPVTVDIQRLTLAGLPDGHTIATGTASNAFFAMSVSPAIDFPIDARFAFVLSSPTACDIANAVAIDNYQGGDAYVDAGNGWQPLALTDNRFDLPFRTLIQPALPVGYLSRSRGGFTATLLTSGKVLLAGNDNTAELYDPATNTSTPTGSMSQPRSNHTATLLSDGRVLIAGGRDFSGVRSAATEIYDPATGTFAPGPTMSSGRESATATRLGDGRVLVAGGFDTDFQTLQTADIFDPVTNSFSVATMLSSRQNHAAALLQSGKVLLAGGFGLNTDTSAEVFDPVLGSFTATANQMSVPFNGQLTATALSDGRVLIAGGNFGGALATADLYDPPTNTFTPTGSMNTPRLSHTATLLGDGSVLIAGGDDAVNVANYSQSLATLERYIPATGTFVPAGSMEAVRHFHSATALPDGTALIVGGFGLSFMTGNTAEVYDAATVPSLTTTTLPDGQPGSPYPPTTLSATGGSGAPYRIDAFGDLPPGINYDPATSTLSGTPAATGVFAIGFKVSDGDRHSNVQSLTLHVGAVNTITSPYRLVDAALNRPYDVQLTASGAAPVIWSVAPIFQQLPAGLTLEAGGRITGAPTTIGFFNFVVRAVDATGQTAYKTLSINVRSPLQITTASALDEGTLFDFYFFCLNTIPGNGFQTWTVTSGDLPRGVTLQPFGCLAGEVASLGTFTFTAQVADESSPPQVDSRTFTIAVSTAIDQGSGGDTNQPPLSFGGAVRIAQHVTTGISGPLNAFRVFGVSCPVGATITGQIQGLTPAGAPDGTVLAAGTAVSRFSNETITIGLSNRLRYAADSAFALVLSADQTCEVHPAAFDTYGGGDAFVSTATTWRSLFEVDGRHDLPFETVITPPATLGYTTEFRAAHSATVLQDGRVLIAGGSNSNTAEIYDPVTRLTTPTTGSMSVARRDHVATLLDDGTVLITGGWNTDSNTYLSSAELFHPDTGRFDLLASPMSVARTTHTATKLGDGRVLIAGGQSGVCCSTDLASAEIYNPASRTFTTIAPMSQQRRDPTATLLIDGRVLIAGGYGTGFGNAEIFDPATSTFAFPILMPVRAQHTATRLADGRVLLAGGAGDLGNPVTTALVFDPALGTFTPTGPTATPHVFTTATALADGSVLLAGGATENACCDSYPPHPTLERYLPGSNSWVGAGSLLVNRYFHTASRLADGTVLFAGTFAWSVSGSRSFEIYDPATAVSLVDATPPAGRTGEPYPGFTFVGQGGSGGPYSITQTAGVLPPGLVYDNETHDLSGTPTTAGTYTPVFTVADTVGHANSQTVVIAIDPLVITTAAVLPEATFGQQYTATLTATGIGAATWTIVSGILPPGLSLVGNLITGAPTVSCCFYGFTVRAVDAAGQTATLAVGINVREALAITTTELPDAIATQSYFGCIDFTGGVFPLTWTVSGDTPRGLAFFPNSSCFDGSFPDHQLLQAGAFNVTVTVTDSSTPPHSDSKTFALRVGAIEQTPFSGFNTPSVPLTSTRRVAQVVRAGTPFDLIGVEAWSISSCTPDTVVTATIRPVSGSPARPDESGDPLAVASVTVPAGGFFSNRLSFAPVPIPRHGQFAVVLSFANGSCEGFNWPTDDFYRMGDGFVSDGGGAWQLLSSVVGAYEVPLNTIVLPARNTLAFQRGFMYRPTTVTLASGRILVIDPFGGAEIHDPTTNPPTVTSAGTTTPRYGASATLMRSGKVLIVGGQSPFDTTVMIRTTEVFDENAAGPKFSPGPDLPVGRYLHGATLLASGKLLITGGWALVPPVNFTQPDQAAYVLDENGAVLAALTMTGARAQHTATRLEDDHDRVLIAGGWNGPPMAPNSAEIFDPADFTQSPEGSFTTIPAPMVLWRANHTATLIHAAGPLQRQVLLAGGSGQFPDLAGSSELFDPIAMQFAAAPGLQIRRMQHTATELADGRIAIVGGDTTWFETRTTSSVELFDPTAARFAQAGDLYVDRQEHDALVLTSGPAAGKLYVVGGRSTSQIASQSTEVFDPFANPLVITAASLPDGSTGHEYPPTQFVATGGSGAGIAFSIVSGELPPGLSLNGDTIVGTPVAGGPFSFVVKATDSAGGAAYQEFTIHVDRLSITSTSPLPPAFAGANYDYQFTATGVAPVAWSLEPGNALPPNLTLNGDGRLSGIAGAAGFYFFSVRARDAANQTETRFFSLQIEAPLTVITTTLQDAVAPQFYFGCLQSSGGGFPQTWTTTGMLPPDVALNQFGCFDGEVRKTGTYRFVATVHDAAQSSADTTLTIRSGVVDQAEFAIDETSTPGTVLFGGPISLAQVFTPQINGNLIAMQVPVSCTTDGLTLEIRGVTGGVPNDVIYGSQAIAPDALTPFAPGQAFHRHLQLSTAVFVTRGVPVAAVLTSAAGSCSVVREPADAASSYPDGDAYTGSTGAWTPLSTDRPDIPFTAVVDDGGRLTAVTLYGRSTGTATLLDSGLVFLAGGFTNTTALFNPTATPINGIEPEHVVPGPNLRAPLGFLTATKLPDGRVLIAGGVDANSQTAIDDALLYEPSSGQLIPIGPMRSPRMTHTATLLSNGDVLIAGGHPGDFSTPGLATTEIFRYDAATHSGTFVDGPMLNAGRTEAAAVLLGSDGSGSDRVLITGGWGVPPQYSAELIVGANGGTGSVTIAQPMQTSRVDHTLTMLECPTAAPCSYAGSVLVAGGVRSGNDGMATTAELFDPTANTFTTIATTAPRSAHIAARLNSGAVLLAGGTSNFNDGLALATTEVYSPESRTFVAASDLVVPRNGAQAVHLPDDGVLIVGGFGHNAAAFGTLETFRPATDTGGLGTVNEPFTMSVPATGTAPFTFAIRAGTLPAGLSFDSASGAITGTPTEAGVTRLVIEVHDTAAPWRPRFREVTITIRAPADTGGQANRAPIAADDPVTTSADSQILVTVLANDTDPDNDSLVVTTVSAPHSGSAVLRPDNTVAYTPNAGFSGTDSFFYAISDGRGGTATAQVTVTVTPPPARSNNAGPGAAIVSFFNPASTGDPAAVPGFGTLAAVSFFNPAAVATGTSGTVQSAAAFTVSFVNGPNPTPAQTPTSTNAAAPSVSFVNGANPTPATATPTSSNATAPSVSFVNGANPTPTAATPTASSAAAASVSFVNGANPTPTTATPTASSTAAPPVSFVNGANPDFSGTVGSNVADSRVAVVTVAAGPTITSVSPTALSITSASPELVLTGGNLANVTTVAFDDPTGILIGAIAPSPDGHTLTIQLLLQPTTPPRTVMIAVSGPDGSSVVSSSTVFTLVP